MQHRLQHPAIELGIGCHGIDSQALIGDVRGLQRYVGHGRMQGGDIDRIVAPVAGLGRCGRAAALARRRRTLARRRLGHQRIEVETVHGQRRRHFRHLPCGLEAPLRAGGEGVALRRGLLQGHARIVGRELGTKRKRAGIRLPRGQGLAEPRRQCPHRADIDAHLAVETGCGALLYGTLVGSREWRRCKRQVRVETIRAQHLAQWRQRCRHGCRLAVIDRGQLRRRRTVETGKRRHDRQLGNAGGHGRRRIHARQRHIDIGGERGHQRTGAVAAALGAERPRCRAADGRLQKLGQPVEHHTVNIHRHVDTEAVAGTVANHHPLDRSAIEAELAQLHAVHAAFHGRGIGNRPSLVPLDAQGTDPHGDLAFHLAQMGNIQRLVRQACQGIARGRRFGRGCLRRFLGCCRRWRWRQIAVDVERIRIDGEVDLPYRPGAVEGPGRPGVQPVTGDHGLAQDQLGAVGHGRGAQTERAGIRLFLRQRLAEPGRKLADGADIEADIPVDAGRRALLQGTIEGRLHHARGQR